MHEHEPQPMPTEYHHTLLVPLHDVNTRLGRAYERLMSWAEFKNWAIGEHTRRMSVAAEGSAERAELEGWWEWMREEDRRVAAELREAKRAVGQGVVNWD